MKEDRYAGADKLIFNRIRNWLGDKSQNDIEWYKNDELAEEFYLQGGKLEDIESEGYLCGGW